MSNFAACHRSYRACRHSRAGANTAAGTRRVRGTVEKLDGQNLVVKSRDGQTLTVALAPNYTVSALAKKTIADVKYNDYIARPASRAPTASSTASSCASSRRRCAARPKGNSRGTAEPDATMTNATVTGIATAAGGQTVKVKFKDSEFRVRRRAGMPGIRLMSTAMPALLKPGAAVFMVAPEEAGRQLDRGPRHRREGRRQAADVAPDVIPGAAKRQAGTHIQRPMFRVRSQLRRPDAVILRRWARRRTANAHGSLVRLQRPAVAAETGRLYPLFVPAAVGHGRLPDWAGSAPGPSTRRSTRSGCGCSAYLYRAGDHPVARYPQWQRLALVRRMVGVAAFAYG